MNDSDETIREMASELWQNRDLQIDPTARVKRTCSGKAAWVFIEIPPTPNEHKEGQN